MTQFIYLPLLHTTVDFTDVYHILAQSSLLPSQDVLIWEQFSLSDIT